VRELEVRLTPLIWMEARCASVASVTSENWIMPEHCHQTADGGFFDNITSARKHFLRSGWKIIDDDWGCPVCAKIMKG